MNEATTSRHWATEVYPESAPVNWQELLADLHLEGFVSPCHDSDIYDRGEHVGEHKKPHYHILVTFSGKKSRKQMQSLFTSFGGVGAECVSNFRAYARYLCHLDEKSPCKAVYDTSGVLELGGLDYNEVSKKPNDRYGLLKDMMAWVRETHCHSFAKLMDFSAECEPTWFELLCDDCANLMTNYIKSFTWTEVQN